MTNVTCYIDGVEIPLDRLYDYIQRDLKEQGWTPPQEKAVPEWTPKKGELVLVSDKGNYWSPEYYACRKGQDYVTTNHAVWRHCRPHQTHLRWETGALPEKGQILVQWKGTLSDGGPIIGLWPAKDIHKESCDVKRWARLPLEES